jgi:hypothetical protein
MTRCELCAGPVGNAISFSVLIYDGDTYLSVGCDGKDAVYLFNGIDLSGAGAADVVKERMERAMKKEWECCVERYVDVNGEPIYRLFNTMFA